MAKKRKEKDEEDSFDFKIPKFDEKKFIKKEKRNIKTLFISFLFGVVIALISFGFWVLLEGNDNQWILVLIFGLFSAAWIKYLFLKLNIDLTDFGRKGWFGSFAVYFFSWLLVFILLVNPPFYDDEPPSIDIVVLPEMQELGGNVKIIARITDNSGVEKTGITFNLTHEDGTDELYNDFTFEDSFFSYNYINPNNLAGDFNYKITATDSFGVKIVKEGTFTFSNDTIKCPDPQGVYTPPGPSIGYASTIKFDVGTEVSRLYYSIDGGNEINVTEQEGDYYVTYPEYEGWPKNTNVSVKVYAETIYYFEEPTDLPPDQRSEEMAHRFNNTIVDSDTYYFNVSGDSNIGTKETPEAELPKPRWVQVPGFEMLILIVSLITMVLILKYRKKDRRN